MQSLNHDGTPDGAEDKPGAVTIKAEVERYCLGLLIEECGRVLQDAGRAVREGLEAYLILQDGRDVSSIHCGIADVLAAIEFATLHGLIHRDILERYRNDRLVSLCDPANRNAGGEPLAPQPIGWGMTKPGSIHGCTSTDDLIEELERRGYTVLPDGYEGFSFAFTSSRQERGICTLRFGCNEDREIAIPVDWHNASAVAAALRSSFPPPG